MAQSTQYDPNLHNPQGMKPGDQGWDPNKAAFPEGATMGGQQQGDAIARDESGASAGAGSAPIGTGGTGPTSQSRR